MSAGELEEPLGTGISEAVALAEHCGRQASRVRRSKFDEAVGQLAEYELELQQMLPGLSPFSLRLHMLQSDVPSYETHAHFPCRESCAAVFLVRDTS